MTCIQILCDGQGNLWSSCTRKSIWNILLICCLQEKQGTDTSQMNLQNYGRFKTGTFWQFLDNGSLKKPHLYCLKHSKAPIFNGCSQSLHSPAARVIGDESAEHENPNNMCLSTCCSELQQQTHRALLWDIHPNTFPPRANPTSHSIQQARLPPLPPHSALLGNTDPHSAHTELILPFPRGGGDNNSHRQEPKSKGIFRSQSSFPPAFLQYTLIYFIFNIYLNSLTPFWLQIESSYTELWTVVTVGIFWVFPLW